MEVAVGRFCLVKDGFGSREVGLCECGLVVGLALRVAFLIPK